MYSYRPPQGNAATKALTFSALIIALLLFMSRATSLPYAGALQMLALVFAMGGIMLCTRYLMTGYVYTLEQNGAGVDLVIVEEKGKARRTVCRISVNGATLTRDTKLPESEKKRRAYNYCPAAFDKNARWFISPESESEAVKISVCDELVLALFSAGAHYIDEE